MKKIHNIVSSASEAETFGTLYNGKTAISIRPSLIILDHKQPATPLKADNSTKEGFVNLGMKPKRSKIWDMKWHWLIDKEVIEQLIVYWDRGTNNEADYFTKHHPPIHHRQRQPLYINTSNLVRKIHQTIILCEGVLNRVPCTQSCVYSLNTRRSELQYMTKKFHTIRRLNHPRK